MTKPTKGTKREGVKLAPGVNFQGFKVWEDIVG